MRHVLAVSTMGAAVACVVAASLASADPPQPQRQGPQQAGDRYLVDPVVTKIGPLSKVGPMAALAQPATVPMQCHPGFYCYSPRDMKQAYNIPTGPGAPDGTGQTIIVVAAFGSPFIQDDLALFDNFFGLPDPSLTIIGPNGQGDLNDPNVVNWLFETTLDVEWAHATAPGANIVLAIAQTDEAKEINKTLAKVLPKYPGAIVSQSFGADETFVKRGLIDELKSHMIYAAAVAIGDTVLGGSGDFGASNGGPAITAAYPASDPLVTGVGGTMGLPWPNGVWLNGGYGGEQVWNETFPFQGATGGAPSGIFPSPSYQRGVTTNSKRTVPDVSFNASTAAGVLVVVAGGIYIAGGVSASVPQWAGIFALANQLRAAAGKGPLGLANPALYAIYKSARYGADFHDITVGNNIFDPTVGGFTAAPGYDLASGIGTPNVGNLLADLTTASSAGSRDDCNNDRTDEGNNGKKGENSKGGGKGNWCDLAVASVFSG